MSEDFSAEKQLENRNCESVTIGLHFSENAPDDLYLNYSEMCVYIFENI